MKRSVMFAAGLVTAIIAVSGQASQQAPQQAVRASFEVAAVKSNNDRAAIHSGSCHGIDFSTSTDGIIGEMPDSNAPLGRCIARALPLKALIAIAYDIRVSQTNQFIEGGPGWLSDTYDIDAEAEKPVPLSQLRLMLQSLLAERFKLAVHRTKKELPVFDLVVAKGGPKLQEAAKDKECIASATLGPCHNFAGGRGRGLHGQSITMTELALNLSFWAGQAVINKTALSGAFNIVTTPWVPDNPGPNFAAEAGTDPANLPTLFTMLPEQLGLRLEAQKEPIDVVVIDHLERPAGR
jgi:uncharacterized protein (TIGR03435 family)